MKSILSAEAGRDIFQPETSISKKFEASLVTTLVKIKTRIAQCCGLYLIRKKVDQLNRANLWLRVNREAIFKETVSSFDYFGSTSDKMGNEASLQMGMSTNFDAEETKRLQKRFKKLDLVSWQA